VVERSHSQVVTGSGVALLERRQDHARCNLDGFSSCQIYGQVAGVHKLPKAPIAGNF
jgi:hypothetical protein